MLWTVWRADNNLVLYNFKIVCCNSIGRRRFILKVKTPICEIVLLNHEVISRSQVLRKYECLLNHTRTEFGDFINGLIHLITLMWNSGEIIGNTSLANGLVCCIFIYIKRCWNPVREVWCHSLPLRKCEKFAGVGRLNLYFVYMV